jgi:integrase
MNKPDNSPLFESQKQHRLDRSQVYRVLNEACSATGVNANIGTHTMRKTFGYHHYKQFKDVAMLQMIFNHSSPNITLRYIGIDQDEIDESYNAFEL